MVKKSAQKFEHLENEVSFQDEKKNSSRAFVEANNTFFFKVWEPDIKDFQ